MLHVCDINNFYTLTGGGVRTYHQNKMAYFKARGDIEYTLFQPSHHERIEEDGNVRTIHIPAVPVGPDYRYIINTRRLRRIFQQYSPDIVEIGSPYLLPLIVKEAVKGLDTKLVGFWHADYPRTYVERMLGNIHPNLGAIGRDAAWWYARQTYGQFAATFASADCVVQGLVKHGIHRVYQTPLGVDIERFHPKHRDEELRKSVGADGDRPLLFFPHRLLEEKGLSSLLAAYPRVYEKHKPVLVFAGVGPGKPKLDAFMAKTPDVHYLGYIKDPKDMARWYASADAVFALSAFETFGLSAAEAMASGCAMIAANAGAVEELVSRSQSGVLVPYNDVDALAEQTNALLDSGDLKAAGERARAFADKHFSWKSAFDRMVNFYEEIHAAPSPNALRNLPRRWEP